MLGSGCGSVGKAVASVTRRLQFESSDQQILYWTFIYCQQYWKDENKEKDAGNAPFLRICFYAYALKRSYTFRPWSISYIYEDVTVPTTSYGQIKRQCSILLKGGF